MGDAAGGGGRFDNNAFYRDRYWKSEYFDALEQVRRAWLGLGLGASTLTLTLTLTLT